MEKFYILFIIVAVPAIPALIMTIWIGILGENLNAPKSAMIPGILIMWIFYFITVLICFFVLNNLNII